MVMGEKPVSASATEDFGGGLCDCVRVGVACALLWETGAQRQRIHRARWDVSHGCDTRVVIAGVTLVESGRLQAIPDPVESEKSCLRCGGPQAFGALAGRSTGQRFHLSGECPCRPMLVEVFLTAHQYLVARGAQLRQPAGAARRHVANRQHDYARLQRHESGAQVRTDRLSASARARQLASDEQRLLLVDIANEAGSEAPLEGDAQLEYRLAVLRGRRARVDAETVLDDVRRDLAAVRAHFETGRSVNAGSAAEPDLLSWWEAYIERPLGRRPRASNLPAATAPNCDDEGRLSLEVPCPSSEGAFQRVFERLSPVQAGEDGSDPLIATLRESALADPRGDRASQLEATLRRLAAAGTLHSAVVENFLADRRRRAEAVDALNDVLATIG